MRANEPIESPCTKVCTLDENSVCIGCGRTLDEIARWIEMTPQERAEIMERLTRGEATK